MVASSVAEVPQLIKTQGTITELKLAVGNCTMQWIPTHLGVQDNEGVNELAKKNVQKWKTVEPQGPL